MVSPNVKRWVSWAVVAGGILTVPLGAWAFGAYLLDGANDLDEALNQRPTMATSPFIRQSPTPTPTPPMQTPTYNVTTTAPEETPTTSAATPTKTPTPTLTPTPSPHRNTVSPTSQSANFRVIRSHFDSTGKHSGLAYIDLADINGSDTHSTEYTLRCRDAGAVVMSIVSFTNGELAYQQGPTEYPELNLCDGDRVAQGLIDNAGQYAGVLSPYAHIS